VRAERSEFPHYTTGVDPTEGRNGTLEKSQMPDQRKERIEEILEDVTAVSPAERANHISNACGGDPEMTDEVTSLVASADYSTLTEFLEQGLPKILRSAAASTSESNIENEANQLRQEEDEERKRWQGVFIGDEFENKGRYEIAKLRRFGLMASLFYGADRKMDTAVVVKIPRRSAYVKSESDYEDLKNLNANIRNNFRREFDALRKLQRCSYVVRVQDFGDLPDGRPFMIQEFIDGKNALELLNAHKDSNGRRTGLAFHEVVNIIRQAGKGLQAAHDLSILHRDMKAENIMITHDGHVKLIDFNAADVKLPISPMSTVFKDQTWGTLGYVSPEQLQNMMETDFARTPIPLTPASDVYSLAVTSYQLLTGKMPFSSNVTELVQQQASCSFRPASELRIGVASEIDHLLRSALNPNPAKRPQTPQEFATAFARALEELGQRATEGMPIVQSTPAPVTPAPVTPIRFTLRDEKRTNAKKIGVGLAAVLVLLLASGFVLWILLSDRRARQASNARANVNQVLPSGGPLRSFSYWLDLTRSNNGKPIDRSIRASGQEVFTNGDYFVVNFTSPQDGYLYLLNEGRNHRDATSFYYEGKYRIKPNTHISSSRLGFDNKDGTEQFWFLFSSTPVEILEKYEAPREIPEKETEQVRQYLAQTTPTDLASAEDISNAQTNVEGSGRAIAYKAQLRHRKSE
jgi:serine/threonine protein kinase